MDKHFKYNIAQMKELKNKVDYVVKSNRNKLNKIKASTIIKFKPNGDFEVLRQ